MKKSAFTLAEIMIVLTVIGILTGILMPIAFHSAPDENVMKFKKAHNTFTTAIRELVNSDKYYLDGDLGVKPNGDRVQNTSYLCETLADVITTKDKKCEEFPSPSVDLSNTGLYNAFDVDIVIMDQYCIYLETLEMKSYIKTQDNFLFFEANPGYPFGKVLSEYTGGGCSLKAINNYYDVWDGLGFATAENPCLHFTSGFYFVYKPFCIDIDGVNAGEAPFGYGLRVDGKILLGARALEWLEKSIQKGE